MLQAGLELHVGQAHEPGVVLDISLVCDMLSAPRIDALIINGERYALGELSIQQKVTFHAAGVAIVERRDNPIARDPLLILKQLLFAADSELDWNAIRPFIRHEHVAAVSNEAVRQCIVAAMATTAAAGRA